MRKEAGARLRTVFFSRLVWASEQQIELGGNNIGAMPGLKGNAMERIIAGRFQAKGDADVAAVSLVQYIGTADICNFHNNPPGQHDVFAVGGDEDEDPGARATGWISIRSQRRGWWKARPTDAAEKYNQRRTDMTEVITKTVVTNEQDLNRDPITGTPGAHPLGTGAGAAPGGVAGAAVGLVAGGPVGAVVGAAVGAIAGGLLGKGVAEAVNPTAEEHFWRETYIREPYYVQGRAYEYYAPGFRAGWEGRVRYDGRTFEDAEPELKTNYNLTKSPLDADWQDVRPAARAAWDRVDRGWKVAQ